MGIKLSVVRQMGVGVFSVTGWVYQTLCGSNSAVNCHTKLLHIQKEFPWRKLLILRYSEFADNSNFIHPLMISNWLGANNCLHSFESLFSLSGWKKVFFLWGKHYSFLKKTFIPPSHQINCIINIILKYILCMYIVQPNQINMTVLFWYLVKSYASVRYCIVA